MLVGRWGRGGGGRRVCGSRRPVWVHDTFRLKKGERDG